MREFTLLMWDENFILRRQVMMAESIGEAVLKADEIMQMVDITVRIAKLYTTPKPNSDTGCCQVARYAEEEWKWWIPKEYKTRE